MNQEISYEISSKERLYFIIKIIFALAGYYFIYGLLEFALMIVAQKPELVYVFSAYAIIIVFFLFMRIGILTGYLKGNAVKVTTSQFPDIHNIVLAQCESLGIKNTPSVYILQQGGILNAFATSFLGSNYIVLYSDIAEEAYSNNLRSVEFVIGHELGHIKRKHMLKSLVLFPSIVVPFLNSAYSRACEYTCDNIGAALAPSGVKPGLVLLASGKKLYTKVNIDRFVDQENTENGFWFWFAEKISSHPRLTKRVKRFNIITITEKNPVSVLKMEIRKEPVFEESDHNKYLPK